jgi:hypothetical protein
MLVAAVLLGAVAAGCGGPDELPPAPTTTTRPGPATIRAADLVKAFAGLPLTQTRCYTQADDPNSLLGRPGQYVDRCAWHDRRIHDPFPQVTEADGPPTAIGGSIELFAGHADAAEREQYLADFGELTPEWHWILPDERSGIVLLRVSKGLTRAQAGAYRDALAAALPKGPLRAVPPSTDRRD